MFSDKEITKIYALSNENELQESEFFGWCPESQNEEHTDSQIPSVSSAEVAGPEWGSIASQVSEDFKGDPPDELPAFQAIHWRKGHRGVDLRPHLFDPVQNKFLLCDSGSQITAYPPEPGDKVVPGQVLKAVNGTKIECFGYKNIGRKEY